MQISLSTRQLVNLSTIKLTTMKKNYIHPGITIVKTETYGNFCNYNSNMSIDTIGSPTDRNIVKAEDMEIRPLGGG